MSHMGARCPSARFLHRSNVVMMTLCINPFVCYCSLAARRLKLLDEALRAFKACAARAPAMPDVGPQLQVCFSVHSQRAAGALAADASYQVTSPHALDPPEPQMAACHAELGDYASAVALLEAVAAAQPREPGVLMQLADMYTRCPSRADRAKHDVHATMLIFNIEVSVIAIQPAIKHADPDSCPSCTYSASVLFGVHSLPAVQPAPWASGAKRYTLAVQGGRA
jgi:hypothetical protein